MSANGRSGAESSGQNSRKSIRGRAGERVKVERKQSALKNLGLSTGLEPEEKRYKGKNALGEIRKRDGKGEKKGDRAGEAHKERSLYLPLDEFKQLAVSSSESDKELIPMRKQT